MKSLWNLTSSRTVHLTDMSMYKVVHCTDWDRLGILKIVQYNPKIMSPHVCNFQHERVLYVCRYVYNTQPQQMSHNSLELFSAYHTYHPWTKVYTEFTCIQCFTYNIHIYIHIHIFSDAIYPPQIFIHSFVGKKSKQFEAEKPVNEFKYLLWCNTHTSLPQMVIHMTA